MALWASVDGFRNSQNVEQDVLNKVIEQLRERTDWLRDKLLSLTGDGDFDSVRVSDVLLVSKQEESATIKSPELFEFVYLDVNTRKFAKAIATPETQENTEYIRNGNSSYAIGLLVEKDEIAGMGTVVLSGRVSGQLPNGSIYRAADFLEEGEVFRDGPYYLSSSAYGKVTATVTASAIYVGYFVAKGDDPTLIDYIILLPQYRELQQMHSHQVFPLHCQPSGDSFVMNDVWYILGFPPSYSPLSNIKESTKIPANGKVTNKIGNLIYTDIDDDQYTDVVAESTADGDFLINYSRFVEGESDYFARITDVETEADKVKFYVENSTVVQNWSNGESVLLGKNRLFIRGGWLGANPDIYLFTIGTSTSKSQKPISFDDCYLYWSTLNETELPGRVRLRSYDVSVPVGSQHEGKPSISGNMLTDYNTNYISDSLRGKTLVNITTGASGLITGNDQTTHTIYAVMSGGTDKTTGETRNTWNVDLITPANTDEYRILGFPSGGLEISIQNLLKSDYSIDFPDSEVARTWVLNIPEQIKGWSDRYSTQYMEETLAKDSKMSFVTFTDGKLIQSAYYSGINISYRRLFVIPYNIVSASNEDYVIDFNYSVDDIAPASKKYAFRFYISSKDEVVPVTGATATIPVKTASFPRELVNNFIAAVKDPDNQVLHAEDMMLFNVPLDPDSVSTTGWLVIASKRYLKTVDTNYIIDNSGLTATSPETDTDKAEVTWNTSSYEYLKTIITDNSGNLLYYDIAGATLEPFYTMKIGEAVRLFNKFYIMAIPYDTNGDPMVASTNNISYDDRWNANIYNEGMQSSYVYMIGFHQALNALYPPVPTRASALILDGINQISVDFQPDSIWKAYKAGLNTIYWYGDAYQDQPWASDWKSYFDQGSNERTCIFHFVRLDIGDVTAVTSLQPVEGSPIKIYKCGTKDPAATGDLSIDVEIKITDEKTDIKGAAVYKAADGMVLKTGYMVEKLIAGENIILEELDPLVPIGDPYRGTVRIKANIPQAINMGYFDDISLLNAKQEIKGLFSFVSLLPYDENIYKIPSAFLLKFRTPINLPADKTYELKFYFTVFGTKATTSAKVAGITLDHSICKDIVNYDPGDQDTLISPITSAPIDITFGPGYEAYDPFMVTNDSTYDIGVDIKKVSITIGGIESRDTIALKISAKKPSGTPTIYDGNFGFLAMSWELTEVV